MAEHNAESSLAYLYTARALRMASKYIEASRVIGKSLELDPHSAEAHFERGCIERGLGHPDEAEKSFLEALRLQPQMSNASLELGEVILTDRRDPDGAMPYFKRALEFNPSDAKAYFDMGYTYMKKHQIEAAEKSLARALELDPAFSRAHYLRGSILQRQGRREEAEHEFAQARKLAAREHLRIRP
jgi:tetratricopeptide (TPR) repeat protein